MPWTSLSCMGLLNFDESVYCDSISSMFRKNTNSDSFIFNYIARVTQINRAMDNQVAIKK